MYSNESVCKKSGRLGLEQVYSNEGHAATPAHIFPDPVDSSNQRIFICDMPSFPVNCANGCNNYNNFRCVNHTIVTCNFVNCDKVFHFG